MPDLAPLIAAIARAKDAPLSRRRAMLAVLLADDFVERCYSEDTGRAEDVLAFRAGLAAASPALKLIFALAAMEPDGARLVVEAVAVPVDETPGLSTPDFMVSLYNSGTVQRVRIAVGDARWDVLAEAVGVLREILPRA